ncbi:MAG: SGNH/GDSL hydrolase family protein [Opitutales bacterium]
MKLKILSILALLIAITILLCNLPTKPNYSRIFIFGDSLSDAGNNPNEEDYNCEGRWSNGIVWNEYLAPMLSIKTPTKSTKYKEGDFIETGDTNFAHGGAMTAHGITELVVPSIHEQIVGDVRFINENSVKNTDIGFDRYKTNFKADDLILTWGGANNLFFSFRTKVISRFEKEGEIAANEMKKNLELLIERDAKNIVVLNLPNIGATPRYNKNAEENSMTKEQATEYSQSFNKVLKEAIRELRVKYQDVNFMEVDIYALLNDILANPKQYDINNITDPMIDSLNAAKTDKSLSSNPADYLFYDDVHLTTAGHKLIATFVKNNIK